MQWLIICECLMILGAFFITEGIYKDMVSGLFVIFIPLIFLYQPDIKWIDTNLLHGAIAKGSLSQFISNIGIILLQIIIALTIVILVRKTILYFEQRYAERHKEEIESRRQKNAEEYESRIKAYEDALKSLPHYDMIVEGRENRFRNFVGARIITKEQKYGTVVKIRFNANVIEIQWDGEKEPKRHDNIERFISGVDIGNVEYLQLFWGKELPHDKDEHPTEQDKHK